MQLVSLQGRQTASGRAGLRTQRASRLSSKSNHGRPVVFRQPRLPAPTSRHVVHASSKDAEESATGLNEQELRASMDEAVKSENYAEAARLRDLLREAEMADPVKELRMALANSIDEEDYETAAELRDQLRELVPVMDDAVNDNRTASECGPYSTIVTHGIRVEAWSEYHPTVSVPDCNQWFFRYHIKIHNQTDGTVVQLKARHWIVTDAEGRMDQVKGPGVVGEQPILSPGQSFEYSSACPLRTPGGCMQGEFEMHVWDQDVEDWTETIHVSVGRFGLVLEKDNVIEDA